MIIMTKKHVLFAKKAFKVFCLFLLCFSGYLGTETNKTAFAFKQAPQNTETQEQIPQFPAKRIERYRTAPQQAPQPQQTPNTGFDRTQQHTQNREFGRERPFQSPQRNTHNRNIGNQPRVAILLPLSGQKKVIGEAMLQAAQLAIYDMGYEQLELIPRDTQGTAEGARKAANDALNQNVSLILGPLYSEATRAAKEITARRGVNMISFSTDWTLTDPNTYVMGFLPFAQIKRLMDYVYAQNYLNLSIIASLDKYGDTVTQAFENHTSILGITSDKHLRFKTGDKNLTAQLKDFSNYSERQTLREETQKNVELLLESNPEDPQLIEALKKLQKMDTYGDPPFQAVFMPVGGAQAQIIANGLSYYGLYPTLVKRLGTGLWDNPVLAKEPNLEGAWFAAPSPTLRLDFEKRYEENFSQKPPRLSSLAYDAAALAVVLAQSGMRYNGQPAFDYRALTNPNGFSGIDGIFRFKPNGLVERGLAVLEYQNGNIVEIDPAPTSFELPKY